MTSALLSCSALQERNINDSEKKAFYLQFNRVQYELIPT